MGHSILNDLWKVSRIYEDGRVDPNSKDSASLSEEQELVQIGYRKNTQDWFQKALKRPGVFSSLWKSGKWHAEQYIKSRALKDIVYKVLNSSDAQAKLALLNALAIEFNNQAQPLPPFHQELAQLVAQAGEGLINTSFDRNSLNQAIQALEQIQTKTGMNAKEFHLAVAALKSLQTLNAIEDLETTVSSYDEEDKDEDGGKDKENLVQQINHFSQTLISLFNQQTSSKVVLALLGKILHTNVADEIVATLANQSQPLTDQLFKIAYEQLTNSQKGTETHRLAADIMQREFPLVSSGVVTTVYRENPSFDFFEAMAVGFASTTYSDYDSKNKAEMMQIVRAVYSSLDSSELDKKFTLMRVVSSKGGKEGKAIVLAWEISTWLQMPDEHQEKNGVLYVITTSLHEGIKPASTEPLPDHWKTSVWQAALKNNLEVINNVSRAPRPKGYGNSWREYVPSHILGTVLQLSTSQERETFFQQWLKTHTDRQSDRSVSHFKQALADFDRRLK